MVLIAASRPLQNSPFCPISASDSNFNLRNTQCIPVVKIIALLELRQKLIFFKGLAILAAALMTCALTACTVKQTPVAPGTIPRVDTVTPQQQEFGDRLYKSLKKNHELSSNRLQVEHLQSVFDHLKLVAKADKIPWHVYLFDDPDVIDVRSVWGNYIFIWSGFLNATESDDEIAAILAYEMTHALTWHNMPVQYTVWSEIFFDAAELGTSIAIAALSQGMVMIGGRGWMKWIYTELADLDPLDRKYSQAEEREATSIGLLILSNSKFSPNAMLTFWHRIQANETLQQKAKPLSRSMSPQERVVMVKDLLQQLSENQNQISNNKIPQNTHPDS